MNIEPNALPPDFLRGLARQQHRLDAVAAGLAASLAAQHRQMAEVTRPLRAQLADSQRRMAAFLEHVGATHRNLAAGFAGFAAVEPIVKAGLVGPPVRLPVIDLLKLTVCPTPAQLGLRRTTDTPPGFTLDDLAPSMN
jgi:hypothetical protein